MWLSLLSKKKFLKSKSIMRNWPVLFLAGTGFSVDAGAIALILSILGIIGYLLKFRNSYKEKIISEQETRNDIAVLTNRIVVLERENDRLKLSESISLTRFQELTLLKQQVDYSEKRLNKLEDAVENQNEKFDQIIQAIGNVNMQLQNKVTRKD
jgi:hypothetical protein